MPPPSTRSTSRLLTSIRLSSDTGISLRDIGLGLLRPTRDLSREDEVLSRGASLMVFSPQAGHLPIHLEVSLPQEVQYHTVLTLAGMDLAYEGYEIGSDRIFGLAVCQCGEDIDKRLLDGREVLGGDGICQFQTAALEQS